MKMTLVRRQPQTHDTESFYFKSEAPLAYQPGQYLHWSLPHPESDERGEKRYFSIASSPTEPEVMFTTKFAEASSSFKTALKSLAIGQVLEAEGPEGDFVLPSHPDHAVVLVAGGVGITPFRSMLKYMADSGQNRPVYLLYGCRSEQDQLFAPEIDQWSVSCLNLTVTYLLGQASASWNGQRGNLSGRRILDLAGDLGARSVYLSGPELMVKSLQEQLIDLSVPENQIQIDDFPGYADILEKD